MSYRISAFIDGKPGNDKVCSFCPHTAITLYILILRLIKWLNFIDKTAMMFKDKSSKHFQEYQDSCLKQNKDNYLLHELNYPNFVFNFCYFQK